MSLISDNVKQNLVTLVPSSVINEITCFVFYDNHPRDNQSIDITICTSRGEVKEFYQRELVYSTVISSSSIPVNLKILRDSKCALFYLVNLEDEIVILSRRAKLQVHYRIKNFESYELEDFACRGRAYLKIIRKDDAVPLIFDENFENLGDKGEILNSVVTDSPLPLMLSLSQRLTDTKFKVKNNEKAYKDLLIRRQGSAYSVYKNTSPNVTGAVFNDCTENTTGALTIKSKSPWVKVCNGQIVIILEILNKDRQLIEDVYILLHTTRPSTVYTTKLFEYRSVAPYWNQKNTNSINNNAINAAVLVADIKELQHHITSRIDISGVIAYKIEGNETILPFNNVPLSVLETMSEQFDVLSTLENDLTEYKVLALLATTENIDLVLRHIKKENDPDLNLLDLFCQYMQMERVLNTNIIVHRKSPYHILHGAMVILEDISGGRNKWIITLHVRSPPQILAFIHYMHDAIPYRIIVTTTNQKITAKSPELATYNESSAAALNTVNYNEFGMSLLNQTTTILEYLDGCMIKMNENRDPTVQDKIGREIDIFAGDVTEYLKLRNNVMEETLKGIESITNV